MKRMTLCTLVALFPVLLLANDPPPPPGWTVQELVVDDPQDPGPHTQEEAEEECDQMETEVQSADIEGFDNDVEADYLLNNAGEPFDEWADTKPEIQAWYTEVGEVIPDYESQIPLLGIWEGAYATRQVEGDEVMVVARWMRQIARNRLAEQKWDEAYNAAKKASREADRASLRYGQAFTNLGWVNSTLESMAQAIEEHLFQVGQEGEE